MSLLNKRVVVGAGLIAVGTPLVLIQHNKQDFIELICRDGGSICAMVNWALEMRGLGSVGWFALFGGICILFFSWFIADIFVKIMMFMIGEKERIVPSVQALIEADQLNELERKKIATTCFAGAGGPDHKNAQGYSAFIFDQVRRTLEGAGDCWRSNVSMAIDIDEPRNAEGYLKDHLRWNEITELMIETVGKNGCYTTNPFSEIPIRPDEIEDALQHVDYEVFSNGNKLFSFQESLTGVDLDKLIDLGHIDLNGCHLKYDGRVFTFGSKISIEIKREAKILIKEQSLISRDSTHSAISFRSPTKGITIRYNLPNGYRFGTVSFSPRKYYSEGKSPPIVEVQDQKVYMSTSDWVLPGVVAVASWSVGAAKS